MKCKKCGRDAIKCLYCGSEEVEVNEMLLDAIGSGLVESFLETVEEERYIPVRRFLGVLAEQLRDTVSYYISIDGSTEEAKYILHIFLRFISNIIESSLDMSE